ncbi:site-specific integrase [Parabacteroides distasonis]|uniref:site-specific integrase n=1 Tax=Parabacteroides distasonis TaxID=823 RepID=UPI00189E5701|nr:site-specific integrase [Parabacteroides distasonis]MDB9152234.1 site-specific integrase [Parabacteroides distasonis]MDB9156790.1 site-specific integrase [Parabacteroides distasonis]MDB9165915.1 site-specific integrase [Parabacteroides distasonis]MDB9170322.1 site-specific integrase [Parabacteroides distasonis]MDB9194392.1 site-specific integrase [Parabacteroides distasonis]
MQINRSTFAILFYLNTSKQKKSGKCPVMGRISVDGKNTAFSTGIDILPDEWNAQEGMAIGKANASLNRRIEDYKTELENHYKALVESKGYITAESLKNALRGIGTNKNTLMQEFAELVDEKRNSIGIKIKESTYPVYPTAYRHMADFLSLKYNVADISFGKVDIAFIEAYSLYLKIELQMTPRTVRGNMIPLKATIRRAKNKGLIHQNPFFDYTPEKVILKRPWLTNDEIVRLMQVQAKFPTWNFTRDMFIFCVFTGITGIDLRNLEHSHIQRQEDGSLWIILNRQKTGTASYIPLLDIPIQILDKYKDSEFAGKDGRIFKLQSHAHMNRELKQLAIAANIDKRLRFHMSRFTFATTVCLTQGIPIESLSQMMGHLSIRTTQIYAEVTRTKINEDMTNLAKRIEGKYELAENAIS